jgi:hypothetical protein
MIHLLFSFLILGYGALESQTPRSYNAPFASDRIVIDGRLDDPSWARAPWTTDFVDILGEDAPTPPLRTRARILWDDKYLYVGADMEEPHLWATLLDRDAIIYRDDDFEVFLDPDGDGLDYFEVEVNPYGTVLDLFMDKPYNKRGSADIGWNLPDLRVGVFLRGSLNDPSKEDDGWSVEIAIPWEDLVPPGDRVADPPDVLSPPSHQPGHPPNPGDQWRINFSRVDWPVEVSGAGYKKTAEPSPQNRHPESNWVWSPQGAVNMHIPEMWGVVRFVKEPEPSLEFPFY